MTNKTQIAIWALYDWANSSFTTIVTTFIFANYFTQAVATDTVTGTSQWAHAAAVAGILIALCSPVFGVIADYNGRRKVWLAVFTAICIVSAAGLWYAYPTPQAVAWTLGCFIVGSVALEVAGVFYNAMLPMITSERYYGRVSGWAWGFGYFGGLTSLVVALYGFVQPTWHGLNTEQFEHVRICGPLVAVWFAVFACPLLIWGPDGQTGRYKWAKAIRVGLVDIKNTLITLPQFRNVFYFLLARLFYIDGLNTVFAFGGIYAGGTFGLNTNEVIKFGIVMNVSAGLGAWLFAWLDDLWGAKRTILASLAGITLLGLMVVFVQRVQMFIALALVLGMFVGPIQASSRSLMARIVPKHKANEFFGLYALSGKITAFLGPALLGEVTSLAGNQRAGMASLLIFFVIGGALLVKVKSR